MFWGIMKKIIVGAHNLNLAVLLCKQVILPAGKSNYRCFLLIY